MSNATLTQVTLDGFRDALIHLTQQKTSKARSYTDQFSPEAETGNWDRLSSGDMAAKTRKQATPETGRVWSRRIAIATPYNDSEITEVEDPSRMLIDPNSNLVQSMGMAAGRQMDDNIFAAAIGTATNSVRAGDGSNTPTQIALGAGQIIGTGAEPMSFDVVTQAQLKFMSADIDPSEPKVAFVSPRHVYELMNLTEQTSSDYVNAQALQTLNASGIVPNWIGFTWVMSTRLPIEATGERDCIFMTTGNAVGLHTPEDITTFVERDPSLSYAWRPYCQFDQGAVRLEEERVVRAHLADPDAP